jgi:hypothetical protein
VKGKKNKIRILLQMTNDSVLTPDDFQELQDSLISIQYERNELVQLFNSNIDMLKDLCAVTLFLVKIKSYMHSPSSKLAQNTPLSVFPKSSDRLTNSFSHYSNTVHSIEKVNLGLERLDKSLQETSESIV